MQGKSLLRIRSAPPSVKGVFSSGPPERCYLVEWYQSALLTGPLDETVVRLGSAADAENAGVHLVLTLAAPSDEVLYSLFTADSVETVNRVCSRAGWPPDRITSRVDARFAVHPAE